MPKTKKELQEDYNVLENEYYCVQMSWLFCCAEDEESSAYILDISDKLGLDISFFEAYYKQAKSLKKLHQVICEKLNLDKELNEECKEIADASKEEIKEYGYEEPNEEMYEKLKDLSKKYNDEVKAIAKEYIENMEKKDV